MKTPDKRNITLIQPPLKNVLEAATPRYIDKNRGNLPPLGLLYIKAAIEKTHHKSIFIDADLMGWDYSRAAKEALMYNPDIIGLSATTFTIRDSIILAREIRRLSKNTKILIGGPHTTIYPKETAALDEFDYVIAGEGEYSTLAFLDAFNDKSALKNVPGIAFKDENNIFINSSNNFINDLDKLPFPARKSSHYLKYNSILGRFGTTATMITSRGCPFNCIFCNRMGRHYRFHSANYVLDEFDEINKLGIHDVFIFDDTFTLNRERVVDICRGLIERKYHLAWDGRTRVDCVDYELLKLMKKANCRRLSFGVESGSPQVLKQMRKEIKIEKVKQVFKWCRELGITTLADFMIGNLAEMTSDVTMSLNLLKEIRPDYVQWSILTAYPGTPIYQLGIEKGLFKEDVWKRFASNPMIENFEAPIWTEFFTREDLQRIAIQNYKQFYLKPSFIFRQLLRTVANPCQFKTMAKLAKRLFMCN